MNEEDIISRAKFLYTNEYPKNLRKCVEQAVNELTTVQDICEMSNNLGCSLYDFIDDIYKGLCKDCGVV